MILQALYGYYNRLKEQDRVPPFGFSMENVGFILEISKSGQIIKEHDIREGDGAKLRPRLMEIPYSNAVNVRANNVEANFLVDKAAYLLGNDLKTKPPRLQKAYEKFQHLFAEVSRDVDDTGLEAVRQFHVKWNPIKASNALRYWTDLASDNAGFIAFRLEGELQCVHQRETVRHAWIKYVTNQKSIMNGHCLVTGEIAPIQRLHTQFKGLRGEQSSGKSIVSINFDAAESYGRTQAYNSPVSIAAEFKGSTALKYLIRSEHQKLYIDKTAVLFWTERDSPIEGFFGTILGPRDTVLSDNQELSVFLQTIREGTWPTDYDPGIRFYILGLSPNAARLSVRFWHVSTVKDICTKLGQHFSDLSMIRSFDSDPEYPGMWRLLKETCNQKLQDKMPPPLLGGAVMRSILTGAVYPQALLSAVIGRIRAEASSKDKNGKPIQNVNYMRAAIIKAVLTRKHRIFNNGMEVSVSLDKENKNPAYLMGRLFAVLEKVQEDAHRDASGRTRLNATIRDKFYSSASATPQLVFPQLLKLKNHNIRSIDNRGLAMNHEKLVGEIIDRLDGGSNFPKHFNLENQGLFAIGYYQQRQDF